MQLLCSSNCPVWKGTGPPEQCVAERKLRSVLRNTFEYESFRPGQLQAVLAVAHGQDVFVEEASPFVCIWYHWPLVVTLWVSWLAHLLR